MSSARSLIRASALWLLPLPLLLTACGHRPAPERLVVTEVERIFVKPGPAFTEPCAPQPGRRPVESQDDLALLLNDVAAAGADCRARYQRLIGELEAMAK